MYFHSSILHSSVSIVTGIADMRNIFPTSVICKYYPSMYVWIRAHQVVPQWRSHSIWSDLLVSSQTFKSRPPLWQAATHLISHCFYQTVLIVSHIVITKEPKLSCAEISPSQRTRIVIRTCKTNLNCGIMSINSHKAIFLTPSMPHLWEFLLILYLIRV